MSTEDYRLAYLLKRAFYGLSELTEAALAPLGIDGREFAVLHVLGKQQPLSQQDSARQLKVDRTTMVALVDGLEEKRLVARHPDPADRRRNIVELTMSGRETLQAATKAADEAEGRFLDPLSESDVEKLRAVLRELL